MNKSKIISKQSMIAAMYVVTGLIFSPLSFGSVQIRISESLAMLPVFGITNVWGVTIGCFITNLIGLFTGANILGSLDIFFGTLATAVAGIMTRFLSGFRIKGRPVIAALPPIIINAFVVGTELCFMIKGRYDPLIFTAQFISVALGQIFSCGLIGLLLVNTIEKHKSLKDIVKK